MINKLLSIIGYPSIIGGVLTALYTALPYEIQVLIPFENETVIVSGIFATLIGVVTLATNSFMKKTKDETASRYHELASNYIQIFNVINFLKNEVETLKTTNKTLISTTDQNNELLKRNNQLLECDLEAKASNEFIDESVKIMIDNVLEKEVAKDESNTL